MPKEGFVHDHNVIEFIYAKFYSSHIYFVISGYGSYKRYSDVQVSNGVAISVMRLVAYLKGLIHLKSVGELERISPIRGGLLLSRDQNLLDIFPSEMSSS